MEEDRPKIGTHNSATGERLCRWLRPFAWVVNPFSKCQERNIAEQLADGVRVFNLQIASIGGKWRFTHGAAVYEGDVHATLELMESFAGTDEPIYFQLYLDRCLWAASAQRAFVELVEEIRKELCSDRFIMLSAWIEGTDIYPYRSGERISLEEHYWSMTWAKSRKRPLDYIPLPKRHARLYNGKYRVDCRCEYLMLDYYNL